MEGLMGPAAAAVDKAWKLDTIFMGIWLQIQQL